MQDQYKNPSIYQVFYRDVEGRKQVRYTLAANLDKCMYQLEGEEAELFGIYPQIGEFDISTATTIIQHKDFPIALETGPDCLCIETPTRDTIDNEREILRILYLGWRQDARTRD